MLKRRFVLWTSLLILAVSICVFFSFSCGNDQDARCEYDIEIVLQDSEIKGREKVTFYNATDNAFKELKFNLFANAFRKDAKYPPILQAEKNSAYYDGESYGKMTVNKVFQNGKEIEYSVCGEDENVLSVKVNEEVFPEERAVIEIEYEMTLANVIARTGINEKTINLANFYPILCGIENGSFYECVYYANGDPFYSDVADYTVTVTADEKYNIASTGVLDGFNVYNGKSVSKYKAKNVRSFCLVLSENYDVLTDNTLGIEINYYYYDDDNPRDSLKTAVESVEYFGKTFGEYPYKKFSVCQTKFNEGGMEFASLVYISDELEDKAYKEVIIHETAHQWWQVTVGNNEVEEGFLDEGLTEYSVVLFYENHPEYGYERKELISSAEKTYKTFCSVTDKLFGNVNTKMKRNLGEFTSEYEYVNVCYVKPCIMFEELRKSIGDKAFFKGLKRYYEDGKYKNVRTENLIRSFVSEGTDVQSFFESFIDGKVII